MKKKTLQLLKEIVFRYSSVCEIHIKKFKIREIMNTLELFKDTITDRSTQLFLNELKSFP